MRRPALFTITTAAMVSLMTAPAWACGGLVAPNGTIKLARTTTLAAYHDGVEHYVTSFEYAGAGEFGSIVPLPDVPSKVERGGDWTLQRLVREVNPPAEVAFLAAGRAEADVQVLYQTRIDALDITILKGGGFEVGKWATDNGFGLTPDAPEVLDFYSDRSPVFMAAKFNATAAAERGQSLGDGTPIHLTIPTDNPWVPLRILALGQDGLAPITADVFLLTDAKPAVLTGEIDGLEVGRSEGASDSLMADLRSDKSMEWMPEKMWLTHLTLDAEAGDVRSDLAIDATGASPSRIDAGLPPLGVNLISPDESPWRPLGLTSLILAMGVLTWRLARRSARFPAVG